MCWLGPGQEKFCNVLTEQLLLRGAMLRKSEWAVGVVVYTGMQTKLKMNDEETPAKTTQVSERFSLIALQYGLSAPELQWQCRGEWRISPGVNGKRLGQVEALMNRMIFLILKVQITLVIALGSLKFIFMVTVEDNLPYLNTAVEIGWVDPACGMIISGRRLHERVGLTQPYGACDCRALDFFKCYLNYLLLLSPMVSL